MGQKWPIRQKNGKNSPFFITILMIHQNSKYFFEKIKIIMGKIAMQYNSILIRMPFKSDRKKKYQIEKKIWLI